MVVRLEDVAREAGVSTATVSRVFNGRPNVSEATRTAVAAAITMLGYDGRPGLGPDHTLMVGIITPDEECHSTREILRAMTELLATKSIVAVTFHCDESGLLDERAVEILIERRFDGVAVVGGRPLVIDVGTAPYAALRASSVALVTVGGTGEFLGGAGIAVDDSLSIELATERLLSDGHANIGYIARRDPWISVEHKTRTFTSLMASAVTGRRGGGLVERASPSIEGAQLAARTMLNDGVSALICETDWMTIGALRAARELGRQVPADIALVSCQDSPLLRELDPPITAVRQPSAEMGRAAAMELMRQLAGEGVQRGELVFRPELQARASTVRRAQAA